MPGALLPSISQSISTKHRGKAVMVAMPYLKGMRVLRSTGHLLCLAHVLLLS